MWANVKKIKSAVDCTLLFWKFFLKKVLTFVSTNVNIYVDTKGSEMMSPKGRPTEDPKILSTRIRLSEEDIEKLDFCVEKTGLYKSEIIRMGIAEVYNKLKK